mmetsp:Transcript_29732/g.59118  ORF Transcript_29732/g.59118 Transcript_29732/m.59118 type:complete len:336 (+) Transcript_29732:3035-4042(+)
MALLHRGFRPMRNVMGEPVKIGQARVSRIDGFATRAIDHHQMIRARAPAHIHIFAQLNISVGPQQREAPVAPIGQRIGRVPIDPDIARSTARAQRNLSEILKAGIGWIGMIGHMSHRDFGCLGPGEMQELVDLMHTDICQDAAVFLPIKEPIRSCGSVQPMGAQTCCVHNPANRALGNQCIRHRHAWHLEPLREIDGPDAACLSHSRLDGHKLIQVCAARLVRHHIVARLHRPDRQRGPFRRNGRDQRQVCASAQGIFQAFKAMQIRKPFYISFKWLRRAIGPKPKAARTNAHHVLGHAIDMPVVQPNGDKGKGHVATSVIVPVRAACSIAAITA